MTGSGGNEIDDDAIEVEVDDHGTRLRFSFHDLLRYAGPGSPAGVALAFQALRLALPCLALPSPAPPSPALPSPALPSPAQPSPAPLARREIFIETAFRGPGARDGFELVTRAVTEGRYLVTASLEHPERGTTLEQFVFRFHYRDRTCTLLVRPGMVSDEFIVYARKPDRTPDEEQYFTGLKQAHAEQLLATAPRDVFELG